MGVYLWHSCSLTKKNKKKQIQIQCYNETPLYKCHNKKKEKQKQKLQSLYGRETENHNSILWMD